MQDLVTASTRQALLATGGVHAVGDSFRDGQDVVVVHVRPGASATAVPASVDGVPVVVERDEIPRTLAARAPRTRADPGGKHRPVPAGATTSIYSDAGDNLGIGTLGFTLTDGSNYYFTSNNHVWADDAEGRLGYRVTQPIQYGDAIGHLSSFYYIYGRDVPFDLAWAEAAGGVGIDNRVLNVGTHSANVVDPSIGDPVVYSGEGSGGRVEGVVTEVNVSGGVLGNDGQNYSYHDCFWFEPSGQGGDSGAAVVRDDGEPYSPMGQLFAAGGTFTVAHKLSNVVAQKDWSVISSPREHHVPDYNGHPRDEYTYCGSDREAFEKWVQGIYSTEEFQRNTPPGEGTGQLTLGECDDGNGGNGGGDGPPMYDGRPRSDYTYCGSEQQLFEQWQAGEITTEQFQFQTGEGDGTAALTLGSCDGDGTSRAGVGVLLALGVAGAYLWQRRQQS